MCHSLFKYSRFESFYVAEKPGDFEDPVDFFSKHFPTYYVKFQDVKM